MIGAQLKNIAAHAAWRAAAAPGARAFRRGAAEVRRTQEEKLLRLLGRNAETRYGRQYSFAACRTLSDYRRRVPICDYEQLAPWIAEAASGERGVLVREPLERLHLSSGTATASKHIPFTDGLRREFFAGIAPWMSSLLEVYPALRTGCSYWVAAPIETGEGGQGQAWGTNAAEHRPSAQCSTGANKTGRRRRPVPVTYDEDESYLPCLLRAPQRLLSAARSASAPLSPEAHRLRTAALLLCRDDLGLISVWSPSYLELILSDITARREVLLRTLCDTRACSRARLHRIVKALQALDSEPASAWQQIWPNLTVLSCWADGWARSGSARLRELFPQAIVQGKGLLATEGFVTLPYPRLPSDSSAPVLSVCSHVFEFLDLERGGECFADQLEAGREYEVLLTTAGGLYRYRLGDIVCCEGFFEQAPRLRFLRKIGVVSDICGEKLHNDHVEAVLAKAARSAHAAPDGLFVAPLLSSSPPCYCLFALTELAPAAERLRVEVERGLCENYHYRHCRRLGQLAELQVQVLDDIVWRKARLHGARSTAKQLALQTGAGWQRQNA